MVRGGGGGRVGPFSLFPSLCPLRSFLCLFLICTPLTSPAPSSPIVPFCAAGCRLGEDRLLKRTPRRVRSQGAGVRATQGSAGAFIDSIGTWGQREAGAGPTSPAPRRESAHPDCRPEGLATAQSAPSKRPQRPHSGNLPEFGPSTLPPSSLEAGGAVPMIILGPRKP